MVDNICPSINLAFRQLGTLGRIIPCRRGCAGHILIHIRRTINRLYTAHITTGEFANKGNIHTANKTNLASIRCQRGCHPNQIAAFMLFKYILAQVRGIKPAHINDRELLVRIFCGNFGNRICLCKAHTQNDICPAFSHPAHGLFPLGFVRDFKFHHFDTGFIGEFLHPVIHPFIKGFIKLAAHIIDYGRLDIGCLNHGSKTDGRNRSNC